MFEMKRNNQQGMRDKSQIRHLFAFRDICSFSKQEANHPFCLVFFPDKIRKRESFLVGTKYCKINFRELKLKQHMHDRRKIEKYQKSEWNLAK